MQLLFSFDRDMRVEKTLVQTLAYQLSCNSCSRLTGTCELRKLSCKLSLLNSHATLVLVWPGHASWENSHTNSCLSTLMQLLFSFDRDMRVEKTLIQSLASQLSCNSCSRLTGTCELRKLSCKLLLINSHATLVLVWPGHASWENYHANSCLSTLMQLLFSFDRDMRVEKTLIQTLASQLSCNSCSRLTGTCELRKLSCKLLLINSHATLVLVWPGHASWENSHTNSCFSTLMQLLFSFDRDIRVEKTLIQTLAYQLSCNSCSRLTGTCELRKLSCMQTLASQLSFDHGCRLFRRWKQRRNHAIFSRLKASGGGGGGAWQSVYKHCVILPSDPIGRASPRWICEFKSLSSGQFYVDKTQCCHMTHIGII